MPEPYELIGYTFSVFSTVGDCMNEAIFSVLRSLMPVTLCSRSAVPRAFRSVLMVVSLVSTFASCASVLVSAVCALAATWSSWSRTDVVWLTIISWLVTVPDSVPAVTASELRPELSCGIAPVLMVLRAVSTFFSRSCVPVLKSVESLDTLSDVAVVSSLRVLRSLSVFAAVLLVSSSFLIICWYAASSLTDLSRSMSFALESVTDCISDTAWLAVPLAWDTADETLLMLAVDWLAA